MPFWYIYLSHSHLKSHGMALGTCNCFRHSMWQLRRLASGSNYWSKFTPEPKFNPEPIISPDIDRSFIDSLPACLSHGQTMLFQTGSLRSSAGALFFSPQWAMDCSRRFLLSLGDVGRGAAKIDFSSQVVGFQPLNHKKQTWDTCVPTTMK